MAKTTPFPKLDRPAGNEKSQAIPAPEGTKRFKVQIEADDWDNLEQDAEMEIGFEISFDDGKTWQPCATGGKIKPGARDKDGNMPSVTVPNLGFPVRAFLKRAKRNGIGASVEAL